MNQELSRKKAFAKFYELLRVGCGVLDERFDSNLTTLDEDDKINPRWIRCITQPCGSNDILACFSAAQNFMRSDNVRDHFTNARWATLPSVIACDRILMNESTSYSNRKITVLDAARICFDQGSISLEGLIPLLEELNDVMNTSTVVDLLKEDPNKIILRRVPSKALRFSAFMNDEIRHQNSFIKNGVIAFNPEGRDIILEKPLVRSRKSRLARRTPIDGLENCFYLE